MSVHCVDVSEDACVAVVFYPDPPFNPQRGKEGRVQHYLATSYPRSVDLIHGRAIRWAGLTADRSKRRVGVHGLCSQRFRMVFP